MTLNQASKRLAKGTIIYMIGNLSSKILQMLILPIITASLVTSEYGYYDLIITTISLVTPIITFQMIEGMFRYMFDATESEKQRTVSTVTAFLLCSLVVLAGLLFIIHWLVPTLQYPFLIYINYASSILFNYMQKLARCQHKNRQFAVSGVINTIVMLVIQALTLLVFRMGVDGMLIANAISYIVASGYLAFFLKIKRWISKACIDKKKFAELFKYSAPLVPNSIGWWIVSASDRYVITWFMGTAANGVYSIAGKFSQLLTFVTTVFQLAWQESAIMEENSEERDKFYTRTFNMYMKILLGGYLVVLPFIKIIIPILLEESYQKGWLYNPILLIGAVFSAFSQFYGSAYLVFKKTGGAFYTTVFAAIVNIAIGIGFIRWIGLYAPAIGTACSFFVQWIFRAYQMRGYFKVKIDYKALGILLSSGAIVTLIYYMDNMFLQYIAMVGGIIIFFIMNKGMIQQIIKKIKH